MKGSTNGSSNSWKSQHAMLSSSTKKWQEKGSKRIITVQHQNGFFGSNSKIPKMTLIVVDEGNDREALIENGNKGREKIVVGGTDRQNVNSVVGVGIDPSIARVPGQEVDADQTDRRPDLVPDHLSYQTQRPDQDPGLQNQHHQGHPSPEEWR